MELHLKRLGGDDDTTIGALYIGEGVSGYLFSFTIEDERRFNKVSGETRIPAGRYQIELNRRGGMNERYSKYPWHKGMLELQDVPDFDYIYIHPGNDDDDTAGCILPNYKADAENMRGENSFECYKDLYLLVIEAMKEDQDAYILITDEEF
jgi:hypothetical protein